MDIKKNVARGVCCERPDPKHKYTKSRLYSSTLHSVIELTVSPELLFAPLILKILILVIVKTIVYNDIMYTKLLLSNFHIATCIMTYHNRHCLTIVKDCKRNFHQYLNVDSDNFELAYL